MMLWFISGGLALLSHGVSRRTLVSAAAGVSAANSIHTQRADADADALDTPPPPTRLDDARWDLWPALPLAPYAYRRTVVNEAVPNAVWTFDQLLGTLYVHVPIRMTVVAMANSDGGLFVYAPVAPTKECLSLLQPLIDAHGPVRHIVLPSVAPEHKTLAGPFARLFPSADFWVTDQQFSFPLNLPDRWLGFPARTRVLPTRSDGAMWGHEFEHAVLTAKASASSVYQEAAFFHKPSKTLLLCDAALSISAEPPAILTSDPSYRRALLFHARDAPDERVEDTPEVRRKGWQRIALFGNFFQPGALRQLDASVWIAAARKTPMPELGWAGVFPFTWTVDTPAAFERLSNKGAPFVAPIIQIILSRAPEATREWLGVVTKWGFDRVIPAHFDAPLALGPAELRKAFAFVDEGRNSVRFCDEDVKFLRDSLEGLPPDLALFPTTFGSLKGETCNL